jgi:hypothetical protein
LSFVLHIPYRRESPGGTASAESYWLLVAMLRG